MESPLKIFKIFKLDSICQLLFIVLLVAHGTLEQTKSEVQLSLNAWNSFIFCVVIWKHKIKKKILEAV